MFPAVRKAILMQSGNIQGSGDVVMSKESGANGNGRVPNDILIDLQQVVKTYQTPAGDFPALKNINLQVKRGEFVAVIGKSGSGKTTLINMITGIDRPTSGAIIIDGDPIQSHSESEIARWRGLNVGVVFQFFQLLPTLTNAENIMLPMDFCNTFNNNKERKERALDLLRQVEIEVHAHKKPSEISGGQQQRVAIARALANDPPIIVADEPTGNLDSTTAQAIFELFEKLIAQEKTIFLVTHDKDLARRVSRTIILSDGEIIDEYRAEAFPTLDETTFETLCATQEAVHYKPEDIILAQGEVPDKVYVIKKGAVELLLPEADGQLISIARLKEGQHFSEIALLRGGSKNVVVIADPGYEAVELLMIDKAEFKRLAGTP